MNNSPTCPACGTPLAQASRGGMCTACLLQAAMAGDSTLDQAPGEGGAAQLPTVLSEQPGTRIGHYKLLEQIGEGGFGIVWMAEQEEPVRRRVALKIIKLGMDTREVVARFEAERQALAMMEHANIASVFDGGATATGRPYFVMELVKGVPITTYCDVNRFTTRERLELFLEVCHAVQHAHQKGVIHRDLKPSNILVTVKDDRAVPKVIDFGIAKATQAALTEKTLFTRLNQWIGTPAYMSPEQAGLGSLDVDTRSDIYSLGVLLYELLTGRPPFDPEKLLTAGYDAVMRVIREDEPPKPSTRLSTLTEEEMNAVAAKRGAEPAKLNRLLRGDLDWIVMKALEKDRRRRYETANGLADDLRRHLNDEPVGAGAPTARYRVKKFVRKHRVAAAVAAGFVGLLAVTSVLSTSLALWANWERNRAVKAQVAEAKAKRTAEQAQRQTQDAFNHMQIQKADECLANDQTATALTYLARVLRDDRSNRVAAEILMATLAYRSTAFPLAETPKLGPSVHSAQFSPDGQRVLTASADGTARVWDALSGQPLTEPLKHDGIMLQSAQFSQDGLRVVTAGGYFHIKRFYARVWDARTGQPLTDPLKHAAMVNSAQFSPDGLRVVTASDDKSAQVWDARTGNPLTQPLKHDEAILSAQFSSDGLRVLTASRDKTARVWDAQSGKPLTDPLRHETPLYSAQFSPDGRRVVTAYGDVSGGGARVWDAQTGLPLTELLKHGGAVTSAHFSPDGQRLVTTWGDDLGGYARLWEALSGNPLTEPLQHKKRVFFAHFSQDGQRVVTAADTARVWDARTGQPLTQPLKHGNYIYSAQFSPDCQRVVTASVDGTARVWDARVGQALIETLKHDDTVNSAQFNWDGGQVLTASDDGTARLWDARNGELLIEPLKHNAKVASAQFGPDGRKVLTVTTNYARVWNARTGQALFEFMHDDTVSSAQFSPDSLRVLTASMDGTARVWDASTGQPLTEGLKHNGAVTSAHFSPDGLRVVTTSKDHNARVWDVPLASPPIPDWLPELAEAVAGQRFNKKRLLESVSADEHVRLRQMLATASGTDIYSHWARWFFADRSTRTISPFSSLTVPEYVQRRIQEDTLDGLNEAVRLEPTNGLAFARLAKQVLAQNDKDNPRREAEADFLSRRAVKLAPQDAEVTRIRMEIEERIKRF